MTIQSIQNRMLDSLAKKGLTYSGPGSVTRDLAGVVAASLYTTERTVDLAISNSRIRTANAESLDLIGAALLTPRYQGKRAQADYSDGNIRLFTRSGGSFSSLAGGSPSNIVGTRLFDSRNNAVFEITQINPLFNPSTANEVYVSARSIREGSPGNIYRGTLSSHNLAAYTNTILVENRFAIYNGVNPESNESYRLRLESAWLASQGGTRVFVDSVLSSMGIVGKYVMIPWNGTSSFSLIIQPKTGIFLSPSDMREIKARLENSLPLGTSVRVAPAETKYVNIKLVVTLNRILNLTEKTILTERLRRAFISFMNEMSVGQSLDLDELASSLKSVDPRILSLNSGNDGFAEVSFTLVSNGATYTEIVKESSIPCEQDEILLIGDPGISIQVI